MRMEKWYIILAHGHPEHILNGFKYFLTVGKLEHIHLLLVVVKSFDKECIAKKQSLLR